jgi:hypothetical protein
MTPYSPEHKMPPVGVRVMLMVKVPTVPYPIWTSGKWDGSVYKTDRHGDLCEIMVWAHDPKSTRK